MLKFRTKFAGHLLKDADYPTTIPLLQVDIDKAESVRDDSIKDPGRFNYCVVAQSCKRVNGETCRVSITRTMAYVWHEGSKFSRRYELPEESRMLVEAFDKGAPVVPGMMIKLDPPSPGNSLENIRRYRRQMEKNRKEGKKPKYVGNTRKARKRRGGSNARDIEVRNGIFARRK